MSRNNEIELTASQLADLTFNLLANCQEKEARLAKKYDLTEAEFRCLRVFSKNEVLNNKQLAERMHLSASRLTRILDGLVSKGYVTREIKTEDRRNMDVVLTKKGIALVGKLEAAYVDIHKSILMNIEQTQHKSLLKAMKSLLEALEKWIKNS